MFWFCNHNFLLIKIYAAIIEYLIWIMQAFTDRMYYYPLLYVLIIN